MILKSWFLLALTVAWEVSGASFSKVFVQTGPGAKPAVEYLEYPYSIPSHSYASSQLGQLTAAPAAFEYPLASSYNFGSYGSLCGPNGCFYPGQTVASVAPVAPSSEIVEYTSPVSNVPIVYSPVQNEHPGYEFSYVVVDQGTGDHKAHNELSDGGVVRGEYSFLQPNGQVREVTYVADDAKGFNAFVKNFLPVEKVKHTETGHHGAPCHEVRSEALTAHESHVEEHEDHGHHSDHEDHDLGVEHHESEIHEKHGGHHEVVVEVHENHGGHHESVVEVHEKHGGHEHTEAEVEHHEHHKISEKHGDQEHHEHESEAHEKHGGHEHTEAEPEHYEVHEKHGGHEHHESIEHHGDHEHHEVEEGPHENHELRHGSYEEDEEETPHKHSEHEELSEAVDENEEEEEHETHVTHHGEHSEEHHKHSHEEHIHEVENPETPEHSPTHEKLIVYHAVAHEPKHEEQEHHVPHHVDHEGHQEVQEHGAVEGNTYVPYNDVIKCIQAAMAKANNHPSAPRPPSPLTYLVFNKPC